MMDAKRRFRQFGSDATPAARGWYSIVPEEQVFAADSVTRPHSITASARASSEVGAVNDTGKPDNELSPSHRPQMPPATPTTRVILSFEDGHPVKKSKAPPGGRRGLKTSHWIGGWEGSSAVR
jgi:hypothetical protein